MIRFAVERFHEVISDAEPLIQRHAAEFSRDGSADYDRVTYARLDERGQLLIVTARDGGELVGYFSCIVMPFGHQHHRQTPFAESDCWFIEPAYRTGVVILGLFRRLKRELRARGVKRPQIRATGEAAARLFERLGYRPVATVYEMAL